jgi:hypothetical protein
LCCQIGGRPWISEERGKIAQIFKFNLFLFSLIIVNSIIIKNEVVVVVGLLDGIDLPS